MHYSPAQPSPARVFLQASRMVTHSGISSKTMSIQVSTAEEYMPNFRSLVGAIFDSQYQIQQEKYKEIPCSSN